MPEKEILAKQISSRHAPPPLLKGRIPPSSDAATSSNKSPPRASHERSSIQLISVPLSQRIAAASLGAVITSLVTNPLDVVKTRMQSQAPTPTTKSMSADAIAACHEIWTIETCHGAHLSSFGEPQIQRQPTKGPVYHGTADALIKIGRTEGLPGLYRGLAPSLAMAVPSTVLYYSLYDTFRENLQHSGPLVAPLIGGSLSRTMAAIVTAPLELMRTRAQALRSHHIGLMEGMSAIIKAGGWISLWHGLGATLWRDVPFSAMYWLGYEHLAAALGQREGEGQVIYMAKSFAAGAGAGMIAAYATTPFDVIKTRRQVSLITDATGLPSPFISKGPSITTALRCILASEGWHGLFRGWLPRVLRIGPACAIMISTYEGGKHLMYELQQKERESKSKDKEERRRGIGR